MWSDHRSTIGHIAQPIFLQASNSQYLKWPAEHAMGFFLMQHWTKAVVHCMGFHAKQNCHLLSPEIRMLCFLTCVQALLQMKNKPAFPHLLSTSSLNIFHTKITILEANP
jgi:hypothetical protein